MAQVFSSTQQEFVPAPVMPGGFYPSIDRPQIDGRGIVNLWGGGSLRRQFADAVARGDDPLAPQTDLQRLIGMWSQTVSPIDAVSYNFEGLVGPPGPPGPAGPLALTFYPFAGDAGTPSQALVADAPHTNGIVFTGAVDTDCKLLLHFEGTDGDVFTVDSSASKHNGISFIGTAQIDTAQGKFGSSSLLLDGDSDNLEIPDSTDWDVCGSAADDWTIDFFARHTDHVGEEDYISQYQDATNWWQFFHLHGSGLKFRLEIGGAVVVDLPYAGEIADSNWHHIAMCKVGDEYGVYKNGTQVSYVQDTSTGTLAGSLFIGRQEDNAVSWFDGHIDEMRIHHSNIFSAAPNNTPDDTITPPTAASEKVTWTAGVLTYKGTAYSISADATGTANSYIYWDKDSSPTTFQSTNDLYDAIGPDKWVMCYNESGMAYNAISHPVLHGGLIQAGSITSGYGQIADLAVETLKVQDNAITIPTSAYTSGSIAVGVAYTTVQTVTFTSTGQPVFVSGCYAAHYNIGGNVNVRARVRRDSTTIWEVGAAGIKVYFNEDQIHSVSVGDTPSAGSVTYTLQVLNTAAANFTVYQRSLVAIETKK